MQDVPEAFAAVCETNGPTPDQASSHLVQLSVRSVMSHQYVTAAPTDTLLSVITTMSENRAACAVVVDRTILGVLSQEDMLRDVSYGADFHRVTVGERMPGPHKTVPPDTSIMSAAEIMDADGIRCMPVVDGGQLVGVITQKHITRGLLSVYPLKSAADILTRPVATVGTGATVAEASDMMIARGVSCVVALHQHVAAGVVTTNDLLRRIVAAHRDPMTTQVVEIMSFPLICIPPTCSIFSTARKMDALGLHSLVVMTGDQLHGIVTQQDVLRALRAEIDWIARAHHALRFEAGPFSRALSDDL